MMNGKLTKIIATAAVIGGMTIAPLVYWNGQSILDGVQARFNDLQTAFRNATNSITNYKTVLAQKNETLEQYRTLHTQLNDELKAKDTTISELNAKIKELQDSGTTSSEQVKELQTQLEQANKDKKDLQEQVANLQGQIDGISEAIKDIDTGDDNNSDDNSLTAKINKLLANYKLALEEIGKANTAATNLDTNTQYTVSQAEIDKYKTGATSVEDITKGDSTETLYLSYQLIEKSNTTEGKVGELAEYLGNYKDVDAHRESPILLYHKYDLTTVTGGKAYYTVNMNNQTAYNSIKAHSSDWTVYTDKADHEYLLSKDARLNGGTKNIGIAIQLVDDTEWHNLTDLASDNHN